MNESLLDKILEARKIKGYTWDFLASDLSISGNALRTAFTRKKVNVAYLKVLSELLEIEENVEFKSKSEKLLDSMIDKGLITLENYNTLKIIGIDSIIAFLRIEDDKISDDPNFKAFIELKSKDTVIDELFKRYKLK